MAAGGVQRRLQLGQDGHPKLFGGLALPDPDSAIFDVRPAHVEHVTNPLAGSDAKLHHEPFPGAQVAGGPVGVQQLLRPRLSLFLLGLEFGNAPCRVGATPAQVNAVFHENTQDPQRVVGEIGFVGVRVPQPDHVLSLHLGGIGLAHDLAEEIKVLVVVQPGTGFEVPVPGRLSVAVDQCAEVAGDHLSRAIFLRQDARVFPPECRSAEFVLELLRRPSAPLEVEAVPLPVDVLGKLTFCHGACLSCRIRLGPGPIKVQARSVCRRR